ncbi:hypothetical protein EJB05_39236, partial [Eragrostis curvula]
MDHIKEEQRPPHTDLRMKIPLGVDNGYDTSTPPGKNEQQQTATTTTKSRLTNTTISHRIDENGVQAPCLKSLRLISCKGVTGEGLVEAAKELPLLEELEVALCHNIGNSSVYEVVGQVCPQLKHFRLRKPRSYMREVYDDIQWIANMRGLRSLQLFDNPLTSAGLEIILDNCLKMESLDIRHCFNVEMNETLLAKCSRLRTLRLPEDPTDDCDFQVASPVMRRFVEPAWSPPWSPNLMPNWSPNLRNDSDDGDSGEFDFYREPSRYEEDLDQYDKVLPFSMRRFLK